MASIWVVGVSIFLASAAFGLHWFSRALAARRLNAAADAYVTRELAERRRQSRS